MEKEPTSINGIIVPVCSLDLPKSRLLAESIESGRLSYCSLVECRRENSNSHLAEYVIFDVEVERPQRRVHDVRRIERVAVQFFEGDGCQPEVLSLRPDFPTVPHLNLRESNFPRSLCLYDQPWSQIALRWTPTNFIERIRYWFAETAKGALHQDDQPLEPVLFGSGYSIILPGGLFADVADSKHSFQVRLATPDKDCTVLIAEPNIHAEGLPFIAVCKLAPIQQHGLIRKRPKTLADLHQSLSVGGFEINNVLRRELQDLEIKNPWKQRLLLVLAFPLARDGKMKVEVTDIWAFLTESTIAEVGISLGLWEKSPDNKSLALVLDRSPEKDGHATRIDIVSPHFELTPEGAASASGVSPSSISVLSIGAGALGSQVAKLLAQSGFGRWTIVDEDVYLPHNTARHALSSVWVGDSKAKALAFEIDALYQREVPTLGLNVDFIVESKLNKELKTAIENSELILDMSASIPVARHVAHDLESNSRRASLFLNPRGSDLVVLAEDKNRTIPLDCLEMQYYRALAFLPELQGHLEPPDARVRYSRSCRDVTSTIPNHMVALHSAIAANAARELLNNAGPVATIWQANPKDLSVTCRQLTVTQVQRKAIGDWTLVVSQHAINRLAVLRSSRLPNETGGVLIGGYDLKRKIVYVVDTLASPSDSIEWPTLYIRGKSGLFNEVERISDATDGQLEYIGEWHSHPNRCSCRPSNDDLKVFAWLTQLMDDAGLPSLMGIAGEKHTEWYLGKMKKSGGWKT